MVLYWVWIGKLWLIWKISGESSIKCYDLLMCFIAVVFYSHVLHPQAISSVLFLSTFNNIMVRSILFLVIFFYCPLAFRAILEHIPKSGLSMIRKTAIVYVCSNKQVFMCSFQLSVLWSIVEHVDNIIKIPNHTIRLYQQLRSTIDSFVIFVYVIILVAIHFTYIHTYIIGHCNPSVRIIDIVSYTTFVVCVNLIHKWQDLWFKEFLPEICWEEIAEGIFFVFCFVVWPGTRTLSYRLSTSFYFSYNLLS